MALLVMACGSTPAPAPPAEISATVDGTDAVVHIQTVPDARIIVLSTQFAAALGRPPWPSRREARADADGAAELRFGMPRNGDEPVVRVQVLNPNAEPGAGFVDRVVRVEEPPPPPYTVGIDDSRLTLVLTGDDVSLRYGTLTIENRGTQGRGTVAIPPASLLEGATHEQVFGSDPRAEARTIEVTVTAGTGAPRTERVSVRTAALHMAFIARLREVTAGPVPLPGDPPSGAGAIGWIGGNGETSPFQTIGEAHALSDYRLVAIVELATREDTCVYDSGVGTVGRYAHDAHVRIYDRVTGALRVDEVMRAEMPRCPRTRMSDVQGNYHRSVERSAVEARLRRAM